ncbi:MAG: DUF3078 domain-containing protein [Bacteroidetes bacterium]|nr:DUF3078 domain-containing protein [Bacteroidota bacterium]
MKKSIYIIAAALLLSINVMAQINKVDDVKKTLETQNKDTVAWLYSGILNFGANEGFLHNWAAGGEVASLTFNGLFSGSLIYMNHNNIWTNNLDLAYGLNYAYSTAFIPHKTDDRIDFTSKYGLKNDHTDFYFTGLFNFKSQFTRAYDYTVPNWQHLPTSKFMSPGYFTLAAGMEYRKGTDVSLFLSPVAARLTVADKYYTSQKPEGAFGIDYGKTTRMEVGAYFSGRYGISINKNMSFRTRLDLYSNYLAKDKKDSLGNVVKHDNPGNIDVLWDNIYSYRVSKYLSFTVAATFIYDNDIPYSSTYVDQSGNTVKKTEPGQNFGWLQIKQVFTLGLEYKF